MINTDILYSTKDLAKALEVSYDHLRKYRKEYEEHLFKFFDMNIIKKGNSISYIFTKQLYGYIPYKDYKALQKSKVLQKHIKDTLHYDNRQTGSNIARIIIVDGEIQALNWKLSTLTVYVRDELRALVEKGVYKRCDYQWCFLDKEKNQYVLMKDEDIKRLRSYFHTKESDEAEENILSAQEQGSISNNEANEALMTLHKDAFIQGRKDFQHETGYWPIKVPVYELGAF